MTSPNELLKDHPLYGLDQAIADYLAPLLEQKFPVLFRLYRDQEDALTAAKVEATFRLGTAIVGKAITLQEELLACPAAAPAFAEAQRALLDAAEDEWRELCRFYSVVRAELRDLESMAAAQQAAQQSGNNDHAMLVCLILDLDRTLSPAWLT